MKALPRGSVLKSCVPQDVRISGISYDSRKVKPGCLFVCWTGLRFDGHQFAAEAVERGAAAVVTERWLEGLNAAQLVVDDAREAAACLADAFYGHPSRRLTLIGVTGTNGKTTTTYLIKSILEAAGYRVGLIGTIRYLIGREVLPAPHTTPESVDLQELLARMVDAGITHCVMEVSSHSVALKRIRYCRFAAGVFTNITQDHLDFHPTFDDYLRAKAGFFAQLDPGWASSVAVVNRDDPHFPDIEAACRVPVLSYGIVHDAQYRAQDVKMHPGGVTYMAHTPQGALPLRLRLAGQFNVYNSLAALAVGHWAGVELPVIRRGLEQVEGVPGRFEKVDLGQPFTVLVDYAHTPDSLENILKAARPFTANRLWVVFGCGGDRDRSKRPIMGQVAGRLADRVVITSDNPRSEDPETICQEILAGLREGRLKAAAVDVIVERREAIRYAVSQAQPGDTVVIAGKGHETYQIFRDRTLHFDDREEAAAAIRERMGHEAGQR